MEWWDKMDPMYKKVLMAVVILIVLIVAYMIFKGSKDGYDTGSGSGSCLYGSDGCGGGKWDPAAAAEARGLAQAGSYQNDNYGTAQLQQAIGAAYDQTSTGWGGSVAGAMPTSFGVQAA